MKVRIATAWVIALLTSGATAADNFGYPIANPFLATIVGTPAPLAKQHAQPLKLKTAKLPRIKDREIPRVLWYAQRLEYSWAMQDGPAPLIFTVAGTGGYHNGGTNKTLMAAFYNAGYHVVGITSPSHPEFMTAQSSTAVPGHMRRDAADLHRVMQQIAQRLKHRDRVSGYALAGYSLGGTHAAFVAELDSQGAELVSQGAELDSQQPQFNFEKVLLLNPSVSLYNSISKLDRMLRNIPGGVDNLNGFFSEVISRVGGAYTRSTTVEFNPELVFEAFAEQPPTDEELAAVIGVAFRLAAANLIFTADVMNDFGFIKPSRQTLSRQTDRSHYLQVALRVGFTDYFHDFFWPYYADDFEGNRSEFAATQSLTGIRNFLSRSNHIAVVHNEDDVILVPGEISFLRETFGERAFIYPRGGHLGNLGMAQTQADYVGFLTRDSAKTRGAAR